MQSAITTSTDYFINALTAIIIIISFPALGQESVKYKINHYSKISQYFLGEDGKNNLYKIDLKYAEYNLPELHSLKRNDIKLISKRLLPGKSMIKLARYFAYNNKKYNKMHSPKDFFSTLHDGHPHTYVIAHDRLIFTETTATPWREKNKDRLSKHYFISGLQNWVNYAGEFVPYKNPQNDDLFLVFDNGSGTYQPQARLLLNLRILLEENFGELSRKNGQNQIHFVVKKFDQKIDKAKLFALEPKPFLD